MLVLYSIEIPNLINLLIDVYITKQDRTKKNHVRQPRITRECFTLVAQQHGQVAWMKPCDYTQLVKYKGYYCPVTQKYDEVMHKIAYLNFRLGLLILSFHLRLLYLTVYIITSASTHYSYFYFSVPMQKS